MSIPIIKVNQVLQDWATVTPPITDFTIEQLLHSVEIDESYYNQMFEYLSKISGHVVIPMKIVLCPNNHKCDSFYLDEPIDYEEIFSCTCGEEDFEPENVIIVYNFTESFRREAEFLKKKSISQQKQLHLV